MLMKIKITAGATSRPVLRAVPFVIILLFGTIAGSAQDSSHGAVLLLSKAKFAPDDDIKCLASVLENGNPDSGPSTILLKAAPGCVVPPHFHTAEEQLIVVGGEVSTGMDGMADTLLAAGGFAMMPGKKPHWFTCTSRTECLMFVIFDRKYDITWVKHK
jgi:quercetin dioxygenase-like cupin family protein